MTRTSLLAFAALSTFAVPARSQDAPVQSSNPALTISYISPQKVNVGSAAFTLSVYGSAFIPTTVVRWNGQKLTTIYVSATQLTAAVPASLVANGGTADITVQTPRVATSGAKTFDIRPIVSSLSPASATVGQGAFTLTFNGRGFSPNAFVFLSPNHSSTSYEPAVTYISPTKLTVIIPAAAVSTRNSYAVFVVIPHVAQSPGFRFAVTP